MRQNIKYSIFIIYWLIEIIFLLTAYEKMDVEYPPIYLIFSTLALFWIVPLIFEIKSSLFTVLIHPQLPKRIVHESGEYYIKYINQCKKDGLTYNGSYMIFTDKYIYYKRVFIIKAYDVNNPSELLVIIKSKLDELYKIESGQLEFNTSHHDLLNKWDGYTSTGIKRDDKLSKLVK